MASPDGSDGSDGSEALRDVERLTYFSDAVIAIAVTLLVLPLVDEASSDRASSLQALLDESGGEPFVFVLSFVVICRFWLVHHDMFRTLRTFDGRLFWLNALWLLSIVVLPYATELIGQPGGDRAVVTGVYVGTMLVTSCASLGIPWFVARTPSLRRPGARSPRLAPTIANLSVFALVYLLALIVPGQALWGLLLLAPAGLLADRLHPAPTPPSAAGQLCPASSTSKTLDITAARSVKPLSHRARRDGPRLSHEHDLGPTRSSPRLATAAARRHRTGSGRSIDSSSECVRSSASVAV